MSIKDFLEKSKGYLEENNDIFIAILLILTAFGSFGLGRMSVYEEYRDRVEIEKMPASVIGITGNNVSVKKDNTDVEKAMPAGGFYVGSKNGNKYYFPWCSGAKRIKEENKVIFNTKEEALKAGYTPAGNCKGLE